MIQNEALQNPRVIVVQKLYSNHLNKDSDITFPKHRYKKFIKDVVNGTIERKEVIENLIPYVKDEIKKGTRLNQIMRHTLGLFHGKSGSSFWKRYLSENMCVRNADVQKIDHIMDKIKLSPQFRIESQID